MQLRIVAAVIAAILAVVSAQDVHEEGYKAHPKFKKPEAPKAPEAPEAPEVPEHKTPEVPKIEKPEKPESPELPKYEKPEVPEYEKPQVPEYKKPEFPEYERSELPKFNYPEFPEYKQPEFPQYDKPEMSKYEHPQFPVYEKHEMPSYQDHEYPQYPEHHGYAHPDPIPHYAGHPDFSATQPSVEEKMEKKDGDYTPHESKMEVEKMEKKDGDYTPKDSKMEEKMAEKHEGFPVFNFHDYEFPKIEEHNFDNFVFNLTDYKPENATESDYFPTQEMREAPVARTYQPYNHYQSAYPVPSPYTPHSEAAAPGYPHGQQPVAVYPHQQNPMYAGHSNAAYQPGYQQYPAYQPNTGSHQYKNTVEAEGSYYKLDTCEYRFILDMVQCHKEERYSQKVNVQSTGQGHYYQGQGPNYYNNNNNYYYNPSGQQHAKYNGYPYQVPYDSRYMDFMRLYGNPMYYVNHVTGQSYKPGHFDDSLFSYSPSVGHPFYAPGLHNTPFANYYAGFRAGTFEQGHESEVRNYHKEGYYQSALQDFHNLKLNNVVKVNSESESSVKTSSKVSVSDEAAYEGVTPLLGYKVSLLPNHCSVPGYGGKHACIVFSGATHPYRMVHRRFVYLKNTREVQGKYRYRYENGQQVQH